jgi:hypothetical protein
MRWRMLVQLMTLADKDRIQLADRHEMLKAVVYRKLCNRIKIIDPSRVTTDECLSESCRAACSQTLIGFDGRWNVASAAVGLQRRTLYLFGSRLHLPEPALKLVTTLASHSFSALRLGAATLCDRP